MRLARLLTNDRDRAEDLVQDVLARAYPRWSRIAGMDHPDEYLRRMLINAHRSWWRRPYARREVPTSVGYDGVATRDGTAEAADRDAMWRELACLPHRQRCVLVLRYYEDLSDEEIARILGCSPVTIRTHAMRAFAALRTRLANRTEGELA